MAEKNLATHSLPALYGGSGPAEAELLAASEVVSSKSELVAFLNQANKSLIEPIDRTGRKNGKANYFFEEVKKNYPKFWHALNRVRAYRNHFLHL